jgi:orotate phosphoribosyltransferase
VCRVSALPDQALASEIADTLVRTGAVAFRTSPFFRLTSGAESPVYVDNRQLLGHVQERQRVVAALVELAGTRREASGLEGASAPEEDASTSEDVPTLQGPPAAIAGTATAGVPWGAWMADRMALPFVYVRSQAKAWGKERAVEGYAPAGAQVLVIEDLAFSAGSLIAAAENLRDAGFQVQDALTIASYDLPRAHARMEAAGLRHATLTTIDEALAAAERAGSLDDRQVSVVEDWLLQARV